MVCREYMVDRHCVWCSMVGLVKWDNVQNESHGCIKEKGNEKYVCWVQQGGIDTPSSEKSGILG